MLLHTDLFVVVVVVVERNNNQVIPALFLLNGQIRYERSKFTVVQDTNET